MTVKYRGWYTLSAELLRKLLNLPKEVEIIDAKFNSHDESISLKLASASPVENYTVPVIEEATVP